MIVITGFTSGRGRDNRRKKNYLAFLLYDEGLGPARHNRFLEGKIFASWTVFLAKEVCSYKVQEISHFSTL